MGPALLYCALTIAFAYPLSLHPASRVLSHGSDTNLLLWMLSWNAHAIVHQPWAIFDANIFYPFRHSLAFAENLLATGIVASPVLWVTGNPILAMNLVALTSIPLTAIGSWLLARELKLGREAAILAGLIAGFSPPRFFRLEQLHLTTVEWIPFCLAFVHAYLERGKPRDLRIAIGFFTLQALTSGHGVVFLLVALAIVLVYRVVFAEPIALAQRLRDVGIPGLIALLPLILVWLQYRAVQADMGLRRTLVDYRVVSWQSFVASPSHVDQWLGTTLLPDARVMESAGAYLFPGVIPLLLALAWIVPGNTAARRLAFWLELLAAAVAVVGAYALASGGFRLRAGDVTVLSVRSVWRVWFVFGILIAARLVLLSRAPLAPLTRIRRRFQAVREWLTTARSDAAAPYVLVAAVCIWLSIAPPFGLWEWVYWLPGFDFIRAPSRFTILAIICLGIVAAAGFDRLTARQRPSTRGAAAIVAALLMLVEFFGAPLGTTPETVRTAPIDRWLAGRAQTRAIAEVPVDPTPMFTLRDGQQSEYMLHSTAHWQRTVHGYSGVRPELTDEIYEHLTRFPDPDSIRALQSVGVDTVVVHLTAYPADQQSAMARRLASFPALRLEHTEAGDRVYALSTIP